MGWDPESERIENKKMKFLIGKAARPEDPNKFNFRIRYPVDVDTQEEPLILSSETQVCSNSQFLLPVFRQAKPYFRGNIACILCFF